MASDTINKTHNDYKLKDLIEIQKLLSSKGTITPQEASIWLELPLDRIYRLIKAKQIYAYHPFGMTGRWLIDVTKTIAMMENQQAE